MAFVGAASAAKLVMLERPESLPLPNPPLCYAKGRETSLPFGKGWELQHRSLRHLMQLWLRGLRRSHI